MTYSESTCKTFATLFEALLTESSTAIDLVRGNPGGVELMKQAHAHHNLPDNLQFEPVAKPKWSDLAPSNRYGRSDTLPINWLIVKGNTGTGMIYVYERGNYRVLAVNAEGTYDDAFAESNTKAVDWLKARVGSFKGFLLAHDPRTVKTKQDARRKARGPGLKQLGSSEFTSNGQMAEYLLNRFKPLWTRVLTGALNDVKGWVSSQIKNHAFRKAGEKINLMQRLEADIEALETGEETPDSLRTAISSAIALSVAHYNPNTEVRRTSNYSNRGAYVISSSEKTLRFIDDIAKGDTEKLGTVLAYFKRSLTAQ
jgi:hypothetical protein